jgi:hypothetical protein
MLVEIDGRWINPACVLGLRACQNEMFTNLDLTNGGFVNVELTAAGVAKKINDAEVEFQKQAFLAAHIAFMGQPLYGFSRNEIRPASPPTESRPSPIEITQDEYRPETTSYPAVSENAVQDVRTAVHWYTHADVMEAIGWIRAVRPGSALLKPFEGLK